MDKAIETPASGDTGAHASASAEWDALASAIIEDTTSTDEGSEGSAKSAARRRPRRPRRKSAKTEAAAETGTTEVAETVEAVAEPAATAQPAEETASKNGRAPRGRGRRKKATEAAPAAEPVGEAPVAQTLAEPPAAIATTAEIPVAETAAPVEAVATDVLPDGAAPEKRERRRRGGGRRRKATAEPAAEAPVLAEAEPAPTEVTGVAEVVPADETVIVTPDRAAAEPISAGRPEVEWEPPTLPEPPVIEAIAEPLAIEELPAPDAELLELPPPTLPEPPARERGRRRRGRGDRGKDRAAKVTVVEPAPEAVAEPVAEAPVVEVLPSPAPAKGKRGRRGAAEPAAEKPAREPVAGKKAEAAEEPAEPKAAREPKAAGREPKAATQPAERLAKEIIVNVDARETRIAVIENNRLVELHVEREERVVGSIYKGRVANVLPGMDAAFVDIGLERNAFLYVGDILYEAGEENGGSPVYRRAGREVKIRDVAKSGQEILVQVVKGPRGTKGARVSTRMSLPGRYIVLMPEADNLGVSRKIEDPAERDRLKKIGEAVRPQGFGMIIRTEAEGRTEKELRQDAELLVQVWRQVQEKARRTPPPALIHQDLTLLLKTIRDVFGSDVDRMLIDSPSDYQKAMELLDMLSPDLKSRVELYTGSEPIFHRFGLDDEIERLLRRKVWLKSGGYITIDSTEALTAIDVNTGKFIGSTSLSDTILKTNLDAVNEITRQFRLRDLGGMIVIDFIDMASAKDRNQVMTALERALKKDRTRTKIAHISPLGLVEMTRKRTGETVTELLTHTCPYCQGRGRVSSPESVSIQIERLIKRRCAEQDVDAILVHASPEVAACLVGPEGDNVELLEKEVRRPVYVRARHDFHVEKYEIMPGDMMELEQQIMPFRGGQVVECLVQKMEIITAPRSAAWVDGYFVDLANGTRFQGQKARVRLTDVRRSFALGEPVSPSHSLDRSEPI